MKNNILSSILLEQRQEAFNKLIRQVRTEKDTNKRRKIEEQISAHFAFDLAMNNNNPYSFYKRVMPVSTVKKDDLSNVTRQELLSGSLKLQRQFNQLMRKVRLEKDTYKKRELVEQIEMHHRTELLMKFALDYCQNDEESYCFYTITIAWLLELASKNTDSINEKDFYREVTEILEELLNLEHALKRLPELMSHFNRVNDLTKQEHLFSTLNILLSNKIGNDSEKILTEAAFNLMQRVAKEGSGNEMRKICATMPSEFLFYCFSHSNRINETITKRYNEEKTTYDLSSNEFCALLNQQLSFYFIADEFVRLYNDIENPIGSKISFDIFIEDFCRVITLFLKFVIENENKPLSEVDLKKYIDSYYRTDIEFTPDFDMYFRLRSHLFKIDFATLKTRCLEESRPKYTCTSPATAIVSQKIRDAVADIIDGLENQRIEHNVMTC